MPYMEDEKDTKSRANGKILLATAKGDVHDIGKNIVGVVLQCNNYEIIDLGVMVPCEKILQTTRDEKVDIIGVSGLITPSLEEMVHVAKEMERQNFEIPLLIGGATTSRAHTAVKIEQNYQNPVVYVSDASRSVGVVGSLLSGELRGSYIAEIKKEYADVRKRHQGRRTQVKQHKIEAARNNRFDPKWNGYIPPEPSFLGIKTFVEYPLEDLVDHIDWSPFFHTWELIGSYPKILDDNVVGEHARSLFEDAQSMLS